MPDMRELSVRNLDPAQAAELSLLVDLEARWENLRKTPPRSPDAGVTLQELRDKQRAYETFHSLLRSYNKRYTPTHVPELLLNTPSRLGLWCRALRHLYLQVEDHPKGQCPVHLLEKAYRWADHVAGRLNAVQVGRAAPPATIREAMQSLEAVADWCDDLARATAAARPA
jgi:hypothetical protein